MSVDSFYLFLCAFGASCFGGILGMASGIFIVPLLTVVLKVELPVAIATSAISVIACSCAGASTYLKARLTNFRLAMVLEVATTLGAFTGVVLIGVLSIKALSLLFCLILFISAIQMFMNRTERAYGAMDKNSWGAKLALQGQYSDGSNREVKYHIHNLPLGMFLMYLAGVLSTLLGIGSGVLKIPAMDTALRLPLKVSSATSNFMIGVTAASGAAAYFVKGAIVPSVVGPVVIGSVLGAFLGAKVLVKFSSNKLRYLFITILILLGMQMLFKVWNGDL